MNVDSNDRPISTSADQLSATIGGKVVDLSKPYDARVSQIVGRRDEMKLITAAWLSKTMPLSPLLLGEPGVGKNRLVYELAKRTGKKLYIFQGHEDVTAEDLACSVRFSDAKDRKMDYVVSPLVTAMLNGDICFIDEIAKIRPRALALLVSVLDERRYIDSTLLGERVYARPGFRFIAATNTADLEGNALPEFLLSRMRPVIRVGDPPREEIEEIIQGRFQDRWQSSAVNQISPLLELFWKSWGKLRLSNPNVKAPSPRDVIYVFDLAFSLADYEASPDHDGQQKSDSALTAPLLKPKHVEESFEEMYRLQREARN
jgi:MoxR-like ATPase